MPIGRQHLIAWMTALQQACSENRERLTELDAAIGDADHGINMDRGLSAVRAQLEAQDAKDPAALLQTVARALIQNVGGASGPLYGTFFLRAGAACAGKAELQPGDVIALFEAGVEGMRQRGKAAAGDKTMLDALLPALDAMRGAPGDEMLERAAAAAEAGMLATIPMQARKGRASYLGPRSVGHQDPGATSAYLMMKAAAETLRA